MKSYERQSLEDQLELAKKAIQKALGHLARIEQELKAIKEE